jgi:hypothetical protein
LAGKPLSFGMIQVEISGSQRYPESKPTYRSIKTMF